MYYLRKEPYEETIHEIHKTNGEVIPERKVMSEDRAVFKHHNFSRFYRQPFKGLDTKYPDLKLYMCKRLSTILKLRQSTFDYCGEWFDVYDENGKVDTPSSGGA